MPEHDRPGADRPEPTGPGAGFGRSVRNSAQFAGVGYTLIGAIVVLGGLGYLADGWLGTEPWLLLVGLLLGIVVGFYELARVVWRRTP